MRCKFSKGASFIIVFLNLLILYFTFKLLSPFPAPNFPLTPPPKTIKRSISLKTLITKSVTVIIRNFETHENDVTLTAQSFLNLFPNINLFILFDDLPYPPLDLIFLSNSTPSNVKLVKLGPDFGRDFYQGHPLLEIKTKFVLFVPDSTRITSRQSIQIMMNEFEAVGDMIAAPISHNKLHCLRMNVNVKEWTVKYDEATKNCDGIEGKHVLLLITDDLKSISDGFLLPHPQALFLQTAALNKKVTIKTASFHEGKPVIRSHHAQHKLQQKHKDQLKILYNKFKIKLVTRNGVNEWYGCNRDTPRCFPTVLDSMPSYLYEGRHTPPCCLSNLRKTAKHVISNLKDTGVRFWLEAGSLLGAMRIGDILPWDHDVDIGFNRDDLDRLVWLVKAKDQPVIDSKGFYWEKATEGNFYRVHYSKTNRIFVNLFPFYVHNGTMMRDAWFTSHKNMEFPDSFLHPMSSIDFIGQSVPSPNNIRDFLEFKFGRGAIEKPQYPESSRLSFP